MRKGSIRFFIEPHLEPFCFHASNCYFHGMWLYMVKRISIICNLSWSILLIRKVLCHPICPQSFCWPSLTIHLVHLRYYITTANWGQNNRSTHVLIGIHLFLLLNKEPDKTPYCIHDLNYNVLLLFEYLWVNYMSAALIIKPHH